MKPNISITRLLIALSLFGPAINTWAGVTDLSASPLITSTTASLPILPNVFLMMDDSGSMAWDYMPDPSGNFNSPAYGGASNQCNGVFYDPNITYTTPANPLSLTGVATIAGSTSIAYNTTTLYAYPPVVGQLVTGSGIPSGAKIATIVSPTNATLSVAATTTNTGLTLDFSYPNSSFTGAWKDGYNTGSGSVDLSTSFVPPGGGSAAPAYYYTYIGTQTSGAQKDFNNSSSTFYTECNTNASSATITVGSGTGTSTAISSIKVNGTEILSAATTGSTSTSNVASSIAANISLAGYTATVSGSVVTIWPPSASAATYTPVITKSGGLTTTATAFPASPKFIRVTVSATSGPAGNDERTNFANWYSYYRTRILMMRTSTGLAFKPVCGDPNLVCGYRVGFATMNNNTGSDYVGLDTFSGAQKENWYKKLYKVSANNSTYLREALSNVGRMYAMKLPSGKLNGVTVVDPIQYSCQQNFAILTTDGYWNGPNDYDLNGNKVGNQDGTEARPMYDGSLNSSTTTTPYTTVEQRKKVTTGAVTTNTWTKITTSIGATCSVAAVVPASTTTAYMSDNGDKIALGLSATDPDPGYCTKLNANAWICRGNNGGNPVVSSSSVTDSNGTPWYLVASGSNLPAGCIRDSNSFGSSYSKKRGACPGVAAIVGGKYVTSTPATQTETISGSVTTDISNYTATQSTTQTTTNGVVGPVSALTPSPATYTFTSEVSGYPTTTAPTSDTYSSWTTGSASTVCTASTAVPAAGTSTPAITGTTTTAGSATTTVLSNTGPVAGTPTTTTPSPSGGTSDTLADVAEYYYITDLRAPSLSNNITNAPGTGINGTDVSKNNVPKNGVDSQQQQHMTTFTLGLGARGRMVYDPNYLKEDGTNFTPADYYAVAQGSSAGSGVCSWQSSGSCTWPTPAADQPETIDDLWHAAVNGRGQYFSATNPTDLSNGLSSALSGVSARTGAASAATTSNAFVTQNDNFMFRSTYLTQKWTGELIRQQIDVTSGAILQTIDWSAQSLLDSNATRNIYFFDSSSTSKLSSFTYANLSTAQKTLFNSPAISTTASTPPPMSQLCTTGAGTCLPVWLASTPYAAGQEYRNGTTWYHVNTAYTSGATFGATDTSNASVITGAAGANLVNYIRGDRSNEGAATDNTKYFRARDHILGDIVDSESLYIKGALSNYDDFGYSDFITAQAARQSMVYVGANDGMLHAFYAADNPTRCVDSTTGASVACGSANAIETTVGCVPGGGQICGGSEAWAFIPTAVMSNLYVLASKDYGTGSNNMHQYFVDGSPVVADICSSSCTNTSAVWKTILVGGLNYGGKGYYALDITDPANPKALWEFADTNMGYSYGNPKVVKLKNGTWVVLLTSGYNNVTDGLGHLYVVNANTGALITDINTGVGSSTTPSGLSRIDAPVATPGKDATAIAAYGGDLLGNVWRFDINGDLGASGYDAQLLATLKDASGNTQPITSKPVISLVGAHYVIYVGTGQYLGVSDLMTPATQQSFYAMTDAFPTGSTPSVAIYGNPRTFGTFIQQTLTSELCPAGSPPTICNVGIDTVFVSSNNTVNFATNGGWYMDFMHPTGEVDNTDAALNSATLVINTNLPSTDNCSVGGDSYQYQLDYKTGGSVSSSPYGIVGKLLFNELTTRPVVATFSDGSSKVYSQGSGGGTPSVSGLWKNDNSSGTVRRSSWRELTE